MKRRVVGCDLHHAMPQVVVDEIARLVYHLHRDLNEPHAIVHAVALGQDGRFERQFLANVKISGDEVLDELLDDRVHVGSIAHRKQ